MSAIPSRVLRMREVSNTVGFKPAWIYRLIREGQFPAPVKIGKRAVAWRSDEIGEWIASRERVK